jgi:hypothetical protein
MEVSGQLHALAALPPRKNARGTHWIGSWVGPRVDLDSVEYTKLCILFTDVFASVYLRSINRLIFVAET